MAAWMFVAVRVDSRDAPTIAGRFNGKNAVSDQGDKLGNRACEAIVKTVKEVQAGVRQGNVWAYVTADDGTMPTGAVACVQANAATDYVRFTFGTQTITLTEGTDFARGASNTTCAANLATAINAHAVLKNLVTAVGSVGNCNLTAKVPGALLQDIAMSTNDGTAFTFTQLTGGAEGTAQFFAQHFKVNRTA